MVNYDLPWNPIRLEQRMGRIHRIGQTRKCVIFNFCATNTIEGKPLRRLLEKLEQMRQDLGGRVYDVVGHVLAHGGLDFERLLRDALLKAVPIDAAEREIAAIDPKAYKAYEEAIGIAQATKHIDMSWVRQRDWRSEERRLMPEFVEQLFSRAADRDGMRVEPRKDGEHLLRIEHVPRALRDDRLQAVKRLGPPQDHYLKATFRKEVRERAEHEDAVLLSPGSRFRIAGRRSRSACGAKSDEVRSCSTSGRPPTRPPRPARPRPALAPRGRALPPGRGSGRAAHPWSRRADDVREYGRRWVERTWERVGHLYPRIREVQGEQLGLEHDASTERAAGRPIAYLWTRTVPCPNTASGAHELPLVRQTWLAKKSGRYIALRPRVDRAARTVSWEVVEATDAAGLGFDPAGFSSRGRASCMICGAAVDAGYLKEQGLADRMGITPLAAVVVKPSGRGRDYLPAGSYPEPLAEECEAVLAGLDVEPPEEPLPRITRMTGGICTVYGLIRYRQLFTPRQLATLCAFAHGVRETHAAMVAEGMEPQRARAVCAYMGLIVDRLADYHTTLCRWESGVQKMQNTFARQALPMVWDFAENNPFGGASGDARRYVEFNADIVNDLAAVREPAKVVRTSATQLPDRDNYFDAVITDPPYYDNISYADLSDFFYVWLKRSVGFLFEEHVAGELTPKQREVVAVKYRHGNDMAVARVFYEREMAAAFAEAHRVLKPEAPLVCVYAHRTTLGWASLVEALRIARFTITEAWPLDTEMPERSIGQGRASLASSIFLVARRRDSDATGAYHDVLAELDRMIGERLERLTAAGVAGSDLVIAAIGAGLAPFTRYAAVELPSGEPVAAERFLEEVQSRVLGSILSGLGSVDPATRYYVLSRYLFGSADIEFDEANNLARSAGVELSDGLGHGPLRLADIKGKTVHLRDFTERGEEPELGQDGGPLIDVLHGLLWRASHASHEIPSYLDAARPDPEQLRQVAQVLQGKALREEGESKATEAQACERLLGAWSRLVEDNLLRSRT
jgi:putative DNA methylase